MSHTVICALCILTHLNFTMTSFFRTIDIESPQNIKTACFSSLLSFFFFQINSISIYCGACQMNILICMASTFDCNLHVFNISSPDLSSSFRFPPAYWISVVGCTLGPTD